MKRTISILLAMVMVLSLSACGGTRSTPTGGGSSEKIRHRLTVRRKNRKRQSLRQKQQSLRQSLLSPRQKQRRHLPVQKEITPTPISLSA